MKISRETLDDLATLARLRLEEEEREGMLRDLESILEYVEKLSELDTRDVPATSHLFDVETPMRPDRVQRVLPVEEAVRNAPEREGNALVVPKVIE